MKDCHVHLLYVKIQVIFSEFEGQLQWATVFMQLVYHTAWIFLLWRQTFGQWRIQEC